MARRVNPDGDQPAQSKRRRPVVRLFIVLWAVIWPVLSLTGTNIVGEVVARWAPRLLNLTESRAGVGPLVVGQTWPGGACRGSDAVAYPAPAPDPSTFAAQSTDAGYRDLVEVIVAAGGAPYESGELTLYLSATGDSTILVEDMRLLLHVRDRRPLDWAVYAAEGCGGADADVRHYVAELDSESPELILTQVGEEVREGESGFTPFEASANDPTVAVIAARGCAGYYEWGIELTYSISGQRFETIVGASDDPLRTSGGEEPHMLELRTSTDGQQQLVTAAASTFSQTACRQP